MNKNVLQLILILVISFAVVSSASAQTYDIQLKSGWNLISFPLVPQDTAIEQVLSPIISKVKDVWEYDSSDTQDPWKHYRPGKEDYSDLTQMAAKKAYWINVKYNTALQITGTAVAGDTILNLKQGWNIIGWPYGYSQAITEALAGLTFGTDYDQVSRFNNTAKQQEDFLNQPASDDFDTFDPGYGYYIYMLQDKEVTIGYLGPDAPQNLICGSGDGFVTLRWDTVTGDNIAGYNLYRSETQGGPYSKITPVILTTNYYDDNAVTNGTTYYYVVTAVDTDSLESGYSNEYSATPQVPSGPTEVSGNISTDTTWTLAESPYIVIGNVTILSGATLTIEPGVVVKFSGDYYLTTFGALNAQGTPTQNILFTSNSPTTQAGDWGYIGFAGSSVDANCVISYATIEYAERGIFCDNSSPTISHNTIQNNSTSGISCIYNSNPSITYNTIINNGYGIDIDWVPNPNPTVNYNSIYNNTNYNFFVSGLGSIVINAEYNWWGTTDPIAISAKIYDQMENSGSPKIDFTPFLDGPGGNPITDSYAWGSISTDTTWTLAESPYIVIGNVTILSGATLTIEPGVVVKFSGDYYLTTFGALNAQGTPTQNILFTSNSPTTQAGDWGYIGFAGSSVDANCVISYATIEYAERGIFCDNSSPTISHNTIQNNSTSGISCRYDSNPSITYNTIINNGYGIDTDNVPNPNPIVNYNSIYNNTNYNFFVSGLGSIVINAEYNWWGTTDPVAISAKIYDQMENSGSPKIDFTPFLDAEGGDPVFPIYLNQPVADKFVPVSDNATFDAYTEEAIDWTITIKDSTEEVVRTFTQADSDTIYKEWPGYKDDLVTVVDDGTYTYIISGTHAASGSTALPITDTVEVDSSFPVAKVVSPQENGVFAGADNSITGTANAVVDFDRYELEYATDISSPTWYAISSSTTPVTDSTLGTWDASGLTGSSYVLRLQTFNTSQEAATDYVNVKILSIYNVSDSPDPLSPNGDGTKDTTTIEAAITQPSGWVIKIKDEGEAVKRTYSGSGTAISQIWDGKDEASAVVPDGIYTYEIEATEPTSGKIATYSGQVEADNTPPAAIITSPLTDETLSGAVNITGTASDDNFDLYKVEYGESAAPSSWTQIATSSSPVTAGTLAIWDTLPLNNGQYTIKLTVNDTAGNISTASVLVNIDNIKITSVSVNPKVFNPSHTETININYTIDRDADVTISIQDLTYNIIATLGPNPKLTGANTDIWDGTDGASNIVPNDAYTFTIEAANGASLGEYTPEYIPDTIGVTGFTVADMLDPHNNQLCQISYNLADYAGVLIKGGGTEKSDPNWAIVNWEPRPFGSNTDYWNGRDSSGNIVDLNTVTIAIWARALPDEAIIVTSELTVGISTDPYSIIPSYGEFATITYTISEAANVTVSVYNPDGTLVKILEENAAKMAGTYGLTWDGTDSDSKVVSQEGSFTVKVEATGGDGKTSTALGNISVY